MKKSLELKLQQMLERFEEVRALLADPTVLSDQKAYKNLSKEFSQLEPIAEAYENYLKVRENLLALQDLLKNEEPELAVMAEEELAIEKENEEKLEKVLENFLLPKDEDDQCNVYLEIRAGAGGDEAAIFAGDLFRMYSRYAEIQGWHLELISSSYGEKGGYKEIIAYIEGTNVYAKLKFESGAHRVQRVPETESQGRVHTSTCTVAILPEIEAIDEIQVNPDDLRVDTYRSSGAGGQHVNKTESAIRITHLPSGLVVECQEERSQHKNRAKAMTLLKTRLLDAEQRKQKEEQAKTRKSLVGTGDRSERIRTYNFPQGRLTDHRIQLTLYQLTEIMEGHMNPVVQALQQEHQLQLLAEIQEHD